MIVGIVQSVEDAVASGWSDRLSCQPLRVAAAACARGTGHLYLKMLDNGWLPVQDGFQIAYWSDSSPPLLHLRANLFPLPIPYPFQFHSVLQGGF
jgi:hypothetical protein